MGGHMGGGGGGGGGYQGQMGNGMGQSMGGGGGGGGGMQLDQANLNNLMGTLLSNLERNIIQRQTMGVSVRSVPSRLVRIDMNCATTRKWSTQDDDDDDGDDNDGDDNDGDDNGNDGDDGDDGKAGA